MNHPIFDKHSRLGPTTSSDSLMTAVRRVAAHFIQAIGDRRQLAEGGRPRISFHSIVLRRRCHGVRRQEGHSPTAAIALPHCPTPLLLSLSLSPSVTLGYISYIMFDKINSASRRFSQPDPPLLSELYASTCFAGGGPSSPSSPCLPLCSSTIHCINSFVRNM